MAKKFTNYLDSLVETFGKIELRKKNCDRNTERRFPPCFLHRS